jgi:outer membrane protein assembly factor BamB
MYKFVSLCGLSLLAACSGGGSSGGGGTVTGPQPPATLNVTLDKSAQTQTASETDTRATFSFVATYSGSSDSAVYPKISFDTGVLAQDGEITQSGKSYTVSLKSLASLGGDPRTGDVTFRLCRDTACAEVYPGSTQTFRYTLDVKLLDWEMFQRNAAHTAYVHASFDPAKITKLWDKTFTDTGSFRPVSTKGDTVFVTRKSTNASVYALDGATGTQRWAYDIGPVAYVGGPTVTGDQLQIVSMVTSSGNNRIVTLGAADGQFVRNMLFASQWSIFAQPTAIGRELYLASGYYGNVVYGYDLDSGATRWTANGVSGKVWDGAVTAADSQYVYYYSGSLDVYRRSDGALVKSIADPFWVWNGYSYAGGPILGARNNAIAYSGTGMGIYPVSFPLVSYDIDGSKVAWRTAATYSNVPALAKGLLFAASNSQGQLDAIGEDDGKVRWSWPLPVGEQFQGNMIVTDNLVFFSTNAKVYAVSLADAHATVWSAPTPGTLAISANARLVVTPHESGGTSATITSYALR